MTPNSKHSDSLIIFRLKVSDNQPQDWLALKVLCDNETQCEYQYMGSVIESCEPEYIADYMSIYYTCLPGLLL